MEPLTGVSGNVHLVRVQDDELAILQWSRSPP
jgi:hypothetical protein